MTISAAQKIEAAFAVLERHAADGLRCPENGIFGIVSGDVTALARQGRIRVSICGKNFRVVTILVGPCAGMSTAPDPSGAHAWKIVDKTGTRVNGRTHVPRRNNYVMPMTRAERDRRGF